MSRGKFRTSIKPEAITGSAANRVRNVKIMVFFQYVAMVSCFSYAKMRKNVHVGALCKTCFKTCIL